MSARVIDAISQEMQTRGISGVDVAPHEFRPLKRWRNRGRCAGCKVHQANHPTIGWMPARPIGDLSEAYRLV